MSNWSVAAVALWLWAAVSALAVSQLACDCWPAVFGLAFV